MNPCNIRFTFLLFLQLSKRSVLKYEYFTFRILCEVSFPIIELEERQIIGRLFTSFESAILCTFTTSKLDTAPKYRTFHRS